MRLTLVVAALVTGATVFAAGAPARSQAARVTIVDRAPVAVRGTRFGPGESVAVRVIVRGGSRAAKTVRAGAGGTWTARFPGVSVGHCGSLIVRATGERGSRAAYTEYPAPCGAAP